MDNMRSTVVSSTLAIFDAQVLKSHHLRINFDRFTDSGPLIELRKKGFHSCAAISHPMKDVENEISTINPDPSSFNAKQIASAVFFFVDELIPRMCFVFPHGKDWPEYVCTMNSLARLTCVGLVAAGAACDETCAAAAAVSGRILLQQKESIQPMKTVEEPTTLEEPTTTFLFLGFFSVRQNSAQQTTPPNHPFFFFLFTLFFCLQILFFWKTIWDHLLKKSSFHTPFCQMFSFSFADFFERRNWWPSKSCPVNIRKSAGWCVVI